MPWTRADISRAADALGWSPRHSLADSLAGLWAGRLGAPAAPNDTLAFESVSPDTDFHLDEGGHC